MLKNLKQRFIAKVVGVFLLVGLCLTSTCPQGQIYHHQECISCSLIPNAVISQNKVNSCKCVIGYEWSQKQIACIRVANLRINQQMTNKLEGGQQETSMEGSPRLLLIACDTIKGFFNKNNMCVNCRDIAFSSGIAKDQSSCYCQSPYMWNAYYQICGCYIQGTNALYINGSTCFVCNGIATTATSTACAVCSGATFGYTLFGCLNCTSIPFGIGATAGSPYGMCKCQAGYSFNLWLGACVCDIYSKYALNSANTCQACASMPTASVSLCLSCSTSFFYTGYTCKASSLIGNLSTTTNACPTNYVLATNPITNQTTRCVCSNAAGYYTNAGICLSCTTNPIAGIAAAICTTCTLSAGFFLTAKECIYCPNAPYSTVTATLSGCLCKPNYYWSSITSSCICDWTINYVGTGTCISCSLLANTVYPASANGCSCVVGYLWNGTQCVCNPTTTNGIYISAGLCINCNLIPGAFPKVALGGNSCICIQGFVWNSTLQKCICDFNQNYWLINNVCSDCDAQPNTNGAATSSGCQCTTGYIWINTTNKCDCPAGYVNIGTYCASCSTITLPTGATLAGCQVCNVTQGFYISAGICYSCSGRMYTTGASTVAGCTCTNSSFVFLPTIGCACNFTGGFVSSMINGVFSCLRCSGLTCSCGYPGTGTIYYNPVCTNCFGVANSYGTAVNGACSCLPGYAFTTKTYPYQCYCSFKIGYYMPTSTSCLNCSSLPTTGTVTSGGCFICSFTQGFLYLSNDTCVLCSSLPNTTGSATAAGCVCATGSWNSVLYRCVSVTCTAGYIYSSSNMQCVCNPIVAITSGTACILCSSIVNSTGVPLNSTACACIANFAWTVSSTGVGSCVSLLNCNTTTSVLIGTFCLNCSTVVFSTGPILNTINCACPSPLVFVFTATTSTGACVCSNALQIPTTTGASCICNSAFAIASVTTTCFDCRTVTYSLNTTLAGSCVCLANFVWNSTNRTCTCPSPFVISGGQCICNATTSVMIGSICFNCLTVQFSLGGIPGTSNCACPSALVWVYTASTNSGVCTCSNPLQIPSTNGSSCICNPSYAIATTVNNCVDCRTVLYSTKTTVAGVCGCLTNFVWNRTSLSCVCSAPFILSGSLCICDIKVAIIIGTLCFNCLSVPLSTGPILGTTNCICPTTLTFVFNSLTNSGICACTNPLQIASTTSSTCLCNPAYAINSTTTVCFDCRTVLYFGNSTVNGACTCLKNFVWSATSLSCTCLSPYIISGGQCACNASISVPITGGCFNCLNDPNSSGVSTGTACKCIAASMFWNGTACVNICNSTSVYVANLINTTSYICVTCGSTGTNTLTVATATSCSCSGSNLVWNIKGYCDCGTTSALVVTGTTYVCIVCNSAIYSTGQNTSYSCACPAPLTWNPVTQACDCGSAAVVAIINAVYSCVVCNSSIYAASKLSINSCNCISASLVWSSSTYQCGCATANSVIFLSAGVYSCNTCNSTIYSVSALSPTTCSCISTLFVWSANVGCICSSASAIIIGTGITATCLTCNSVIYASSKNSSTTCNCASAVLVWSSTTNQCVCAATNTIIASSTTGYSCVTCNSSIYAVSALTTTSCSCVSTAFVWSSTLFRCSCAIINNVVFLSSTGVYSCVSCNATIYAVSSLSSTTCSCISTLFVWSPNVGCICSNSAAIIVGSGTTATCLVCNSVIYSSGVSTTGNSCVCLGSLTWQGTACGCASPLVILSGNVCGASSVVCSAGLVLLPNNTCIQCTSIIFALSYNNTTTCNCLSAALVWAPTAGTCQCANSAAVILVIGSVYTCATCNSTIFATGKATTRTCACMGTLTWNSTAGTCGCNPISAINMGNYSCVTCNSAVYALSRLNIAACNCIDLTFFWAGIGCVCPAGYIIGANFKCLLCPTGVILNNLTCNCTTTTTPNSIWNDITKTCQTCGTADIPNSIATPFGVACQCVAGYIWDVMTNACILSSATSTYKMTCNKIAFTVLTPTTVSATSVAVRNIIVSASNAIQLLYRNSGSNYQYLTSFACLCSSGLYWNALTMRCYSISFNLV